MQEASTFDFPQALSICGRIFRSYFSSTIAASHGWRTNDWSWVTDLCESRFIPEA